MQGCTGLACGGSAWLDMAQGLDVAQFYRRLCDQCDPHPSVTASAASAPQGISWLAAAAYAAVVGNVKHCPCLLLMGRLLTVAPSISRLLI
jgi:hypothetical protein